MWLDIPLFSRRPSSFVDDGEAAKTRHESDVARAIHFAADPEGAQEQGFGFGQAALLDINTAPLLVWQSQFKMGFLTETE